MKLIRKHALLIVGMLELLPSASVATVYECKAEQALEWTHGRFNEDSPQRDAIFNFDDENGVLSIGEPPSYPESFSNLHIFQKLSTLHDLEADSTLITNDHFIANMYFSISAWDKSVGQVFMYSAGGNVAAGHCIISSKLKSLPFP